MRNRIKVPTRWSDITLNQFIQLIDLDETGNELEDFINRMSVISKVDPDKIKETILVKDISKYADKMSFLSKMPKAKNVNWFLWKRKYFKRLPFNSTESSQVTDIMHKNQNEKNEGARILNVLSVIYYNGNDSEYTGERFDKMQQMFGEMPFTIAWSASLFFLNGLSKYLTNALQGYSKAMMKLTLKQRQELLKKLQSQISNSDLKRFTNGMTFYLD